VQKIIEIGSSLLELFKIKLVTVFLDALYSMHKHVNWFSDQVPTVIFGLSSVHKECV